MSKTITMPFDRFEQRLVYVIMENKFNTILDIVTDVDEVADYGPDTIVKDGILIMPI